MKSPCIYFYGDKKCCLDVIKNISSYANPVYINSKNILYLAEKSPILICIIAKSYTKHDFSQLSKLIDYSNAYRCPILFVGSRHQFHGITEKYPRATIYRTAQCNLIKAIQNAAAFSSKCGGDMFSLLKSRYKTIHLISKEAAFSALIKSKTDNAPKKNYRIVIANELLTEYENSDVIILAEDKNRKFKSSTMQSIKKKTDANSTTLAVGMGEKEFSQRKPEYIDMRKDSDNLMKIIIRRTERKLNVKEKEKEQ